MMADVAGWYQSGPEWLAYGDAPTYVNATQFTVSGNLTSRYTVGRRVRAFVTAGTLYGTISSSAFTSLTTVGVTWDSGNLDSGLSEVDVGIFNPSHTSLPTGIPGAFSQLSVTSQIQWTRLSFSSTSGGVTTTPGIQSDAGLANGGGVGITNNSNSAYTWQVDGAGNMVAAGNIAANSDETLKKDWQPLSSDFIERMSEVLHGTFTRIDSGARQAGVGAQSLQRVLREVVMGDKVLSVAYGNAALVTCIELCKEVVALRSRVAILEKGE
jgi:hypothetical protein